MTSNSSKNKKDYLLKENKEVERIVLKNVYYLRKTLKS